MRALKKSARSSASAMSGHCSFETPTAWSWRCAVPLTGDGGADHAVRDRSANRLPTRKGADGFVVCPLDELGRCELCDSLGVSTAPVVVEQLMPLAAAAAAEERSIVLQNSFAGVGREFVRSFSHRVETGSDGEGGQAIVGDVDVEPVCEAAHLTFEIALQIRIVDE